MNQNIFRSAIRDVRNSTNNYNNSNNNFRSAMKLDKKNVGKEFTEEIDFDEESLNLGEDSFPEENLNQHTKVTKLRSSIIANSNNSYPASFDRKIEIKKNNETVNFLPSRNIDTRKPHKEIFIPQKNKHLVIRNKDNQEIVIHGDCNNNNSKKEIKIVKKNLVSSDLNSNFNNKDENSRLWKHDKFNESVLLKYSIFIRNLPMNITESKIRDIFSSCGPIISVYIERDTAEIYYPRKENALDAVHKFNKTELNGKKVKVSFYENLEENKNREFSADKGFTNKCKTVINLDEFRTKKEPLVVKPNKTHHKGEIIYMDI